jgi:hypothetical protein
MFVPVCDRPSVAEPTEAQDRAVMETKSATIHRKMPMPVRQLPITGSAHKAGIIGDGCARTVLAPFDMTAEFGSATSLDGCHDASLGQAYVPGIGGAPCHTMESENIGHL